MSDIQDNTTGGLSASANNTAAGTAFHASMHGMIRAHVWYGVAGLVLGLLLAGVMVSTGPEFLRASPFFTFMSMGLVMFLAVSMVGGLLSLWTAGTPANKQ